ncbi:MAG: hypothetical protein ACKVHP_21035 [Verrucomicrobiales bacterium]
MLLFLGGCFEPIPFDHPGYPRNNTSLRYPPGSSQSAPRVDTQGRDQQRYPTDRWNHPQSGNRTEIEPRNTQPAPKPKPTPMPKPRVPPPEEKPLVDIDPIEETKPKYEYAIPVQGASNLVVSPYAKDGPYIDVSGLSSGTQIECNKTGKTILVP